MDTEQLQSTIRLPLVLQKMSEFILRQQFSNCWPGALYTLKKYQRPQITVACVLFNIYLMYQLISLTIYHIRN